jgi:hypothetical protein
MEHFIQHVQDPERLILAWQAPDAMGVRTRFAVGEILHNGGEYRLRYHRGTYDVATATKLGYRGYPAFDLRQAEHRRDIMPAFLRRLPPRSRADFGDYLRNLRLPLTTRISDFALLGYSEAKLPGDGFSLVDPLENKVAPAEFLFEIAGYRHQTMRLSVTDLGLPLKVVADPKNVHDPNAIAVHFAGMPIGFVNRLQAQAVGGWLKKGRLDAVLERINGTPDRPRAFAFVAWHAE